MFCFNPILCGNQLLLGSQKASSCFVLNLQTLVCFHELLLTQKSLFVRPSLVVLLGPIFPGAKECLVVFLLGLLRDSGEIIFNFLVLFVEA